jgi:hypothetical protein
MEPLEREMPHPQSPFIQLSKSPVDEPSSRFPKRSPYEKRCLSPEPFLISFRVPGKGALPPGFLHRAPTERERESETLHLQRYWQLS